MLKKDQIISTKCNSQRISISSHKVENAILRSAFTYHNANIIYKLRPVISIIQMDIIEKCTQKKVYPFVSNQSWLFANFFIGKTGRLPTIQHIAAHSRIRFWSFGNIHRYTDCKIDNYWTDLFLTTPDAAESRMSVSSEQVRFEDNLLSKSLRDETTVSIEYGEFKEVVLLDSTWFENIPLFFVETFVLKWKMMKSSLD